MEEIKAQEKVEGPTIVEITVTGVIIPKIKELVQEEIEKRRENRGNCNNKEEIENKEQQNSESSKVNGRYNGEENKDRHYW